MARTLKAQLDSLKATLKEHKLGAMSPHLDSVVDVITNWPGVLSATELSDIEQLIASCFELPLADVRKRLAIDGTTSAPTKKSPFDDLLPDSGWLTEYIEGTIHAEPPTVFHFFCAASILGALTDRRMWTSMGHFRIYPNLNFLLIAPTGKCRKTTAINISTDILLLAGYEKFVLGVATPEAFILDIGANDPASCLIVGREMAAFFRKAKYLEGMIPIFTDLTDCPDQWRSLTIGRGKLVLKNVMLSSAFASTMDWVNTNLPVDVFGGGFMRRFITVAQDRTNRLSPIPPDMSAAKKSLANTLKMIADGVHEYVLDGDARAWYVNWYTQSRTISHIEQDERMAGYLESKPSHVLRMAMLLAISTQEKELKLAHLERALAILDWTERYLPQTFASMSVSAVGDMEEKILRAIRGAGGKMAHSDLVRRMSKYVTADKLYQMVNTLKEGEMLVEKPKSAEEPRSYYLTKRSRGEG